MTENEWLEGNDAYQSLIHVREFASVRKLRLVAAPFVRWLKTLPDFEDARPCADIIEEVADNPISISDLEARLYGLPGTWALSHALAPDDRVGNNLSRTVFMAESAFNERSENPQIVHRTMIDLLREVFGNPFRAEPKRSFPPAVIEFARSVYDSRGFDHLPLLADLLEDDDDNAELVSHFREPGQHVRGCWALDLILGKG